MPRNAVGSNGLFQYGRTALTEFKKQSTQSVLMYERLLSIVCKLLYTA